MIANPPFENITAAPNPAHSLGLRNLPVRLQNHLDRFFQICARFSKRYALRVRSGQFLNEGGVALGKFSEDCGQFDFHVDLVAPKTTTEN